MVTNAEKKLYNIYLRVSRSSRNKPFSYRKDFSDLDDSIALHLKRINNLLGKYPHIKADDYFAAAFKVHPNTDHFPLDFFAGMGGVNAYTIYMRQVQEMSPDSNEQIELIQRSLKYIGMFCIKNKITLDQYPTFKTGLTYAWMKHVKKHEISIYSLMEFQEISRIIGKTPEDEKELFLGEMSRYFWGYKTKYIQSRLAKELVKQGLKKIEKVIKSKNNE